MNDALARRYALALFDVVGRDDRVAARDGLRALAQAWAESPMLRHVMVSPTVSVEEQGAVLAALCVRVGGPAALGRLCGLVLERRRMGLLPEIAEAFARAMVRESGRRSVSVVSARAMDDAMQADVGDKVRAALHGEVDVSFHVDPALVAGVRVHVGGKVFDGSVRGRLNRLRGRLSEMAPRGDVGVGARG